jgi:stress response protein YsnF
MENDMTTVVTAYADKDIAGKAMDALRKDGFEGAILKGNTDKLMHELADHGFSKADAREFADAADEGKTLVAAHVSNAKAEQAAGIMERYEASGDDDNDDDSEGGNGEESSQTVPIVEEELLVTKGKVANGGARVTSSVSESPVEKKVTLREQKVEAERKKADRKLGAGEADAAFEEKTVEVMGTKEEAEVQKEARVVGEVVLTKDAKEREETMRDTVRKTEVEVEKVKATSGKRK